VAQPGADLAAWARLATVVMFAGLALIAMARARRGGQAGRWAAVTFGSLAVALLIGWVGDAFGTELPAWLRGATTVCFIAFPYLLLRFTAVFRIFPRWLEVAAATAAASAAVATLAPLILPRSALPEWTSASVYVIVAVAYWAPLSLVTVATLWQAGRGQTTVARRRMRLMSGATAALAVALLATLLLGDAAAAMQVSVQVTAVASGAAFALGLSPPPAVRLSWRRTEEQHLQDAMMAVHRARTLQEVADELLPPTVRIVGGSGAALVDAGGRVLASHGEGGTRRDGTDAVGRQQLTRQAVPLGGGRGELVVWTSRYAPFFGRDELDLLRTMGAVMSLALERSERLEDERAQLVALEQAQQQADQARDEATRANQAKNEFLSRMSHELRTPLNAILGFGQLLQTATLTDDDRDGVDHILKAGHHLLQLINDVLDLSRIDAGTMTLSLEPVHAAELIDDAAGLIQPLADSRSIRLTVSTDGCDAYVRTDRQRCRQALLNLLSNAVKYNYDGGEVQLRCDRVATHTLRISVCDSGPGIDPARQQRLFEPFDRLGAETSGVEGTGLGLALTRRLVEHMAGTIGVDTALGQGSTFWIDLPVTDQPAIVDARPVRSPAPHDTDERTLLLVEDNLTNLRVIEAMLRRRPGITVLPAMQGSLAIELAYQHQPDIIVLDLHLPDLSGRDVLQRLRADPRTRDIPVVIASADASPGRVRQLLEEGAFAYLTKPLDLHEFLDVVATALAQRDRTHSA
jgi:signal transduction histidine kinase/CheY-like chemotaxis protein